jgi:hypothetical protein
MAIPIAKPSFLDQFEPLGAFLGKRRWRSAEGTRLYTWDSLHGEIEVYNRRGEHVGVVDSRSGDLIKPARKGRTINV